MAKEKAQQAKPGQAQRDPGLEFIGKQVGELNTTIDNLRAEIVGVRAELAAVTKELRLIGAEIHRFR